MDKHTTYFIVLEAMQTAKECPLCQLEAGAIHAYFDAILYEAVNDPKIRSGLVKSFGYCHRHAHYLMDMRDSLGVAILYQDQVQLLLEVLAKKVWPDLKRTDQKNGIEVNCPACQNQIETRQRYIAVVLENIQDREIKTAYEASPGFCIPHLTILLENTTVQPLRDYFCNSEKQNLLRLWNELQEFIRKHDYRYSDEPYGSESNSWIRAIKKVTGDKEIF